MGYTAYSIGACFFVLLISRTLYGGNDVQLTLCCISVVLHCCFEPKLLGRVVAWVESWYCQLEQFMERIESWYCQLEKITVVFLHYPCVISVPIWNPFGKHFWRKNWKMPSNKSWTNRLSKSTELYAERVPKESKTSCKTTKVYAKKVAMDKKNIAKNILLFMKGSNLDFERRALYCCSKTSFARFRASWMREREIHQQKHQKYYQNPSPHLWEIYIKTMLEKVMPTW